MNWNPAQYAKFSGERFRPALDLLSRIPLDAPRRIADLGCGSGNVTAVLRQRWPGASVVGVDSSGDMLAVATRNHLGIEWLHADVASWHASSRVDLVFSNAALHWLNAHEHLFPRLLASVTPGGVLAVQVPRNWDAPSHAIARELAQMPPWGECLKAVIRRVPVKDPSWYQSLLAPIAHDLDIWETEYLHVLSGENPVLEWLKGTTLRPILDALPDPEREQFEAQYRARVARAYPAGADGKTLFPFRRLFIVARKPVDS